MLNIVALISGRGSNLEAILKGIKDKKINAKVSLVISNKRNARGLQIAKDFGVKTLFINPKDFESREDYDRFLVKIIKKENPDLIVLAGYMRILTDYFIDSFSNKIINIHPSLIPAFRGLKAQKQALEFGAKYTGCTVHFVSKEVDSGAVIIQAVVPILPDDFLTLSKKLLPAVFIEDVLSDVVDVTLALSISSALAFANFNASFTSLANRDFTEACTFALELLNLPGEARSL